MCLRAEPSCKAPTSAHPWASKTGFTASKGWPFEEPVIKQVVRLCLNAQREPLSELNTFSEVEVHGIYVIAAGAWIPANVSIRCMEERGRIVIVVNPADLTDGCGRRSNWIPE